MNFLFNSVRVLGLVEVEPVLSLGAVTKLPCSFCLSSILFTG